jgi:fructokinase
VTDPGHRRVLSLGETLIDLIVSDGAASLETAGAFAARPGGAPANVAVALARLGVPAAFCGVVGDDSFGARLRSVLTAEGVDTSRLRSTNKAPTSLAFAWKDTRGDGHFQLLRLADRLLSETDAERAGIGDLAALVVGSVALVAEPSRAAVERAVRIAWDARVPVCFDVNVRPTLWPDLGVARGACLPIVQSSTLLKLSLDDARYLFEAGDDPLPVMAKLRRLPPRFVVLTDGARGAWFAHRGADEVRHVPAFTVEAVEPTGAGDAFTAALLSRLLANGWSGLDDADVRYASAAGALATTKPGAMDGLPTAADLDQFLASG